MVGSHQRRLLCRGYFSDDYYLVSRIQQSNVGMFALVWAVRVIAKIKELSHWMLGTVCQAITNLRYPNRSERKGNYLGVIDLLSVMLCLPIEVHILTFLLLACTWFCHILYYNEIAEEFRHEITKLAVVFTAYSDS